jgi:hypothetical protein
MKNSRLLTLICADSMYVVGTWLRSRRLLTGVSEEQERWENTRT